MLKSGLAGKVFLLMLLFIPYPERFVLQFLNRQITVIWKWNGIELYKACYIQYSIDDCISDTLKFVNHKLKNKKEDCITSA
jgi:hypothetical protein